MGLAPNVITCYDMLLATNEFKIGTFALTWNHAQWVLLAPKSYIHKEIASYESM